MKNAFTLKKEKILNDLSTPDADYNDLSPKGTVDTPIRALIDEINHLDGMVTTSSCSGRISVFLQGRTAAPQADSGADGAEKGSVGGKGGGGSWLFVSHEPLDTSKEEYSTGLMRSFGLTSSTNTEHSHDASTRYVHLKFEAMILHILTESTERAQHVLNAALAAGFRESGAVGLLPGRDGSPNTMVAVRSSGLGLDSIIGYQAKDGQIRALVDETYLRTVVEISNARFSTNRERIERFRAALLQEKPKKTREDPAARRERKRLEGLQRKAALQKENLTSSNDQLTNAVDADADELTALDLET